MNDYGRRIPGLFPVGPTRLIDTRTLRDSYAATETCIKTGYFSTIDGLCGMGKTTGISAAAAALGVPAVYVVISSSTTVRSNLLNIWEAITGLPHQGTEREVRRDIVDYILINDPLMVLDDAHYVRRRGLELMVGIWNEVNVARGRGAQIVLVGNDLANKLAAVPDLTARTLGRCVGTPLPPSEVVDAVRLLDFRAAATDPKILLRLDKHKFKGVIGEWVKFFELLQLVTETAYDAPFRRDDLEQAFGRKGEQMASLIWDDET